jgi:hypothetical protein
MHTPKGDEENVTDHPTDDELMLRHYGELSLNDAARLDAHMAACARCRAAGRELADVLELVDRAAPAEPPIGFERVMWARIQPALPARRVWAMRQLVPLGAWAALVLAVTGVLLLRTPATPAPETAVHASDPAATARAHRRVLFTALNDHFTQTEMLLVEVMNAPEGGRPEFHFERDTAADLVASGRLYRNTASQTGDLHLVAVLDDLEAVLVDVAHGPAAPKAEDFNLLRDRIDAGDLLFKVRAVTTEIRDPQPQREAESE